MSITRRGFFGLLGGALVHEVVRKSYFFAPPSGWRDSGLFAPGEAMFFLPEKDWKYRYAYRNVITGHVSDATPDIARLVHTFAYPEMDVVDIYRQLEDGSYEWNKKMGAI